VCVCVCVCVVKGVKSTGKCEAEDEAILLLPLGVRV